MSRGKAASKKNQKKLLVVGSGGIGCELLKNLILSGFKNIHLVRLLRLRKKHVGMSKCEVAAESAAELVDGVEITPYFANIITDKRCDLLFFEGFDLVLNALDNLEARRHVNIMCLAAGVPLIESGTAGLLGQATAHIPCETECFDCVPHEIPKAFPVCTIRSTPSKPIHCITWAKMYLFTKLFGEEDADEEEVGNSGMPDEMEELKKLKEEEQELKKLDANDPDYAKKVFTKVFFSDIQRLATNEEAFKDKAKPVPVDLNSLKLSSTHEDDAIKVMHKIWSLEEAVSIFLSTCTSLRKRSLENRLEFEKDDQDIMNFVAAASNIRCHIFSIEKKSFFDAKEMAGNIIPAIASTNAIIASFMTVMAKKILNGDKNSIKKTYLSYNTAPKIFSPENLEKPAHCGSCGVVYRKLHVDTNVKTLKDVVQAIRGEGGFNLDDNVELSVLRDSSVLYEHDFQDNEDRVLNELKLEHGKRLTVLLDDDSKEGFTRWPLVLFILHEEDALRIDGPFDIPWTMVEQTTAVAEAPTENKKRKLEEDAAVNGNVKKVKIETVEIKEEDDGIVVLD